MAVNRNRSYLDHVLVLYEDGCELILDTIDRLDNGESIEAKSQPEGGEYFTFPEQKDLETFESNGLRLFDLTTVLSIYERFR
jgi:methionyl-tRNA formyltransferase